MQIVPAVHYSLQMSVMRIRVWQRSQLNRNNRNRKLIMANDKGQRPQLFIDQEQAKVLAVKALATAEQPAKSLAPVTKAWRSLPSTTSARPTPQTRICLITPPSLLHLQRNHFKGHQNHLNHPASGPSNLLVQVLRPLSPECSFLLILLRSRSSF